MALHERAGQIAQQSDLINVAKLISDYYTLTPDVNIPEQAVTFGTSGHRGCAFNRSFNEAHIAAIAQALAEYRHAENIDREEYRFERASGAEISKRVYFCPPKKPWQPPHSLPTSPFLPLR